MLLDTSRALRPVLRRTDPSVDHQLHREGSPAAEGKRRAADDAARLPGHRFVTYRSFEHLLQTLYESSIAFGIRKALQAEQGKTDMENYIAKLEEEKVDVVRAISSLTHALTGRSREGGFRSENHLPDG